MLPCSFFRCRHAYLAQACASQKLCASVGAETVTLRGCDGVVDWSVPPEVGSSAGWPCEEDGWVTEAAVVILAKSTDSFKEHSKGSFTNVLSERCV